MDLNNLALYAMAEPCRRQDEFLRELSMPRIIAVVTETYGGNPKVTERVHPLWDAVAKFVRTGDATTAAATALQRIYFPASVAAEAFNTYRRMVDYRYPRLAVWKAEHGLKALTVENDSLHRTMLQDHPAHLFFAYMVIAIVPLVSDQYPVSQGSFISAHILSTSLKVLDAVFRKEDGVDIVQCLHLLVVFSMHSSAAGSSWHPIGFAMEKCIALGYHKEGSAMADDAEEHRWVFWSCYLLDRLISSALDRPFSINDRDISVRLPHNVENTDDARHVHLFRYAMLLSEMVEDAGRSPVTIQLSGLLHWRSSNPCTNDPSTALNQAHFASLDNTLMLRLAINQIVRANTPIRCDILATPDNACVPHILNISQICQAVVHSLNRPDMRQRSFLSWMTGYSAFSVALLIVWWSRRWTQEIPPETLLETVREILDLLVTNFLGCASTRALCTPCKREKVYLTRRSRHRTEAFTNLGTAYRPRAPAIKSDSPRRPRRWLSDECFKNRPPSSKHCPHLKDRLS
ncbi:fungal-specific transcription factor domain-containing protein [Aspergillus spectabilis]